MERIAPDTVMTRFGRRPVVCSKAYPPGQHPERCPIRDDLTALELKTDVTSRWYGVEKAWIGSDLRMHVDGFNPRFTEVFNWSAPEN